MSEPAYIKTNGWERRLSDWAVSRSGAPFEWGKTDCAILCAEAFDVMTGSGFSTVFRGAYSTVLGAARYQRRVKNLWGGLLAAGCVPLTSPLAVAAGDFLVAWRAGFWCGHVCLGSLSISAKPGGNVIMFKTSGLYAVPGIRALRIL